MAAEKMAWMLSGDCVEACTSPPVCPYYWGSSTPTDLHDGKNQCEGAFTFNIKKGYSGDIDLSGLIAGIGFNTAIGGTASREPWKGVLYLDAKADARQAEALETILSACWNRMGQILGVKSAAMSFSKEQVGSAPKPAYKHTIQWQGSYSLKAEPLLAVNGAPRYISSMMDGIIYVGKSTENKFNDPDLPRGNWDKPEMANTYYEFTLNPAKTNWLP
jgi:hypothetical protein